MKKFLTVVIIICIILLIVIDVKIMFNINDIKCSLSQEVDLLQSQIDDLKKTDDNVNEEI